ncbi:MAG: DUF167 domain-containing protein [Coriobacteriales bacterium]|jgi:uncharacterized protein (TIGR00251 family)|nr:DUF167 domain-containing protein [Coriobacteriales bacterium]
MLSCAAITLAVKLAPRSAADAIIGWSSPERDELKVRVTAAPADGKANAALIKLLAHELGVAKSAVTLVRGGSARHKLLSIEVDRTVFAAWAQKIAVLDTGE